MSLAATRPDPTRRPGPSRPCRPGWRGSAAVRGSGLTNLLEDPVAPAAPAAPADPSRGCIPPVGTPTLNTTGGAICVAAVGVGLILPPLVIALELAL